MGGSERDGGSERGRVGWGGVREGERERWRKGGRE